MFLPGIPSYKALCRTKLANFPERSAAESLEEEAMRTRGYSAKKEEALKILVRYHGTLAKHELKGPLNLTDNVANLIRCQVALKDCIKSNKKLWENPERLKDELRKLYDVFYQPWLKDVPFTSAGGIWLLREIRRIENPSEFSYRDLLFKYSKEPLKSLMSGKPPLCELIPKLVHYLLHNPEVSEKVLRKTSPKGFELFAYSWGKVSKLVRGYRRKSFSEYTGKDYYAYLGQLSWSVWGEVITLYGKGHVLEYFKQSGVFGNSEALGYIKHALEKCGKENSQGMNLLSESTNAVHAVEHGIFLILINYGRGKSIRYGENRLHLILKKETYAFDKAFPDRGDLIREYLASVLTSKEGLRLRTVYYHPIIHSSGISSCEEAGVALTSLFLVSTANMKTGINPSQVFAN